MSDERAWEILRPLLDGHPYLPWTDGAISPVALVHILNEIVFADRRVIAELGAGISTIVIGRLLAQRGGTLTTLEHEPHWAEVVRRQVEVEGLRQVVELVEAPLEANEHSWDGAPWYAAAAVEKLPDQIELLLVDGPPGYGEGMAHSRYPALPMLDGTLAPGALVVLDDTAREAEREILERWGRETEWSFGVDESAGAALGSRT